MRARGEARGTTNQSTRSADQSKAYRAAVSRGVAIRQRDEPVRVRRGGGPGRRLESGGAATTMTMPLVERSSAWPSSSRDRSTGGKRAQPGQGTHRTLQERLRELGAVEGNVASNALLELLVVVFVQPLVVSESVSVKVEPLTDTVAVKWSPALTVLL